MTTLSHATLIPAWQLPLSRRRTNRGHQELERGSRSWRNFQIGLIRFSYLGRRFIELMNWKYLYTLMVHSKILSRFLKELLFSQLLDHLISRLVMYPYFMAENFIENLSAYLYCAIFTIFRHECMTSKIA